MLAASFFARSHPELAPRSRLKAARFRDMGFSMTEYKNPGGAPSREIPDGFPEEVCAWISCGKSLKSYLKTFGDAYDPPITAFIVYAWLRRDDSFAELYARAKEDRADAHADEIIDIADNSTDDVYVAYDKNGRPYAKIDGKCVNRSRLMIDSRKWVAAKLRPNYYGDKLDLTSGGAVIGKNKGPGRERVAIIQEILDRAAARIGVVPKASMKRVDVIEHQPADKVDPFS